MRMSDWSSFVCSSDLHLRLASEEGRQGRVDEQGGGQLWMPLLYVGHRRGERGERLQRRSAQEQHAAEQGVQPSTQRGFDGDGEGLADEALSVVGATEIGSAHV